ncbi:MAG: hypothetical protein NVS1B6_06750 [Steroidobacteraceae bacterium]
MLNRELFKAAIVLAVFVALSALFASKFYGEEQVLKNIRTEYSKIETLQNAAVLKPESFVNRLTFSYGHSEFSTPLPKESVLAFYDGEFLSKGWTSGGSQGASSHVYCKSSLSAVVEVFSSTDRQSKYLVDISSGGVNSQFCAPKG